MRALRWNLYLRYAVVPLAIAIAFIAVNSLKSFDIRIIQIMSIMCTFWIFEVLIIFLAYKPSQEVINSFANYQLVVKREKENKILQTKNKNNFKSKKRMRFYKSH